MISLITRPRRFGKTLNMSMIQRFFEKTEESNAYLFEGLKISNSGEKYLNHQGQYPVISISLKGLKQITYEKAFFVFKERIISEFERHQYVYDSGVLPVNKHKRFEKILIGNAKDDEYLTALQLLSECLEDFHNKKVILLIELNVRCDVALEQIRTKKYAEQLTDDCYQKVMSYGIAFYGKTCRVKMGEIVYQNEE